MFPFLPLLIGAGAGALLNKKKPLQGALLGAGLGAGASFLPGLLGGATGTAGAASGMGGAAGIPEAGLLAAEAAPAEASLLNSAGAYAPEMTGEALNLFQPPVEIVDKGVSAGLYDKANFATKGLLDKGMSAVKPVTQAKQAADMFTPPEEPMPAPPPLIQGGNGSPAFNQILGQQQQIDMQRMQEEMQKRQMQRQRNRMIGRYA